MATVGEITAFFGMKIFTDEGRYVGKIEDVMVDTDSRNIHGFIVVEYNKTLINETSKAIVLPYRLTRAVGDIVLIRDIFKLKAAQVTEAKSLEIEE